MKIENYMCDVCKIRVPNDPFTLEPIGLNAVDGIHHLCDDCLKKIKFYVLKPKET